MRGALSDHVPAALASLPEHLRRHVSVSHQAREEDIDRVSAFYAEHGIRADVQSFFNDIPRRMSEAQLVISRAGASSVADISVIGRPSILIPLPPRRMITRPPMRGGWWMRGAAILLPESMLTPDSLAEQVALVLENSEGAEQMARAALAHGRPDATDALVALVEDLAAQA